MESLHSGDLHIERLNYAHVVLIQKKSEARKVGDFRPISVLNASMKIISKVLVNRLRDLLGEVIDCSQPGFLK